MHITALITEKGSLLCSSGEVARSLLEGVDTQQLQIPKYSDPKYMGTHTYIGLRMHTDTHPHTHTYIENSLYTFSTTFHIPAGFHPWILEPFADIS